MQVNEQLVQAITKEVLKQLQNRQSGQNTEKKSGCSQPSSTESLQGKTRMRPKHSYEGYVQAQKGTNPKEIVIGVGAAFQTEITKTISGIPLDQVLKNVRAGIEEEGMVSRVVKVLDTSDVAFMGTLLCLFSPSEKPFPDKACFFIC